MTLERGGVDTVVDQETNEPVTYVDTPSVDNDNFELGGSSGEDLTLMAKLTCDPGTYLVTITNGDEAVYIIDVEVTE